MIKEEGVVAVVKFELILQTANVQSVADSSKIMVNIFHYK